MVRAAAWPIVQRTKETIARARTASPAALATRPIGAPSIDADAEGHGLGAVLLISRGRPCGCGTMARGWHRCGTGLPNNADAERWRTPDQDSDHGHGLLRTQIRMEPRYGCGARAAADTGTYQYQGTVRGLAQVQVYYSTDVLLCGYAHKSIKR